MTSAVCLSGRYESYFDIGALAFKTGVKREDCPLTDNPVPDDPEDADDIAVYEWLFGWNEQKMHEQEMVAYEHGFKAAFKATLCPYDKSDSRPRAAWIEGWINTSTYCADGCPTEH